MLLRRERSQLLIIDVQARLAPHIEGGERVIANCVRLLGYAARLGVPATITEHYRQGLGPSTDAVLAAAGPSAAPRMGKITFSCWGDAEIAARIRELASAGRDQVVVAGMEAHVCVGQTVLDLAAAGLSVFVVADAVGSRSDGVRDLAIGRVSRAGAHIVAQEMVAFEWLGRGDAPELKDVLRLLK